jgi:hypothetical protein
MGDNMTLSEWIDYLLIANSDMESESNQRFVNQWLESELRVRGFKEEEINAELKKRGWA